jgi:hypothetical protein
MRRTILRFFSIIRRPIAASRRRRDRKPAPLIDSKRDRIVAWHFF